MWVSPFRHLRIKGYLLLPVAFRSLSRPSSALGTQAFSLRSLQLNLLLYIIFVLLRQSSVKKCSTYQCTFPLFYFDALYHSTLFCNVLNAIQYCILFWFSLLIISSMFNIVSIIIFGLIVVLFFFAFAQILQYASLPYFFSLYIFQCATNTLYVIFSVCLVGSNGIEPSTSRLSGVRSNHLSYEPIYQSIVQLFLFCEPTL